MRTLLPSAEIFIEEENSLYRLLAYAPLVSFVSLYIFIIYVVTKVNGMEEYVRIGLYSPMAEFIMIILVLWWLWRLVYLALRAILRRDERPFGSVREEINRASRVSQLVEMVLPVMLVSVFHSVFTSFKTLIAIFNPFHLDPLIASFDQLIHGGVAPWQITHSLVTTPTGTMVIDQFYTVWFLVTWLFMYWQVLRLNKPVERHQFFLAYVLCWAILGSLFAYLLSSAGPCYYSQIYGTDAMFGPLMERLYAAKVEVMLWGDWSDIRALNAQAYLWSNYLAEEVSPGAGISAMPSLHVSMATLFALSAWQVNRRFGWLMIAYAVVIMIGSVHLGWHYATDGYVAIVMTILIWRISGWIMKRFIGGMEQQGAARAYGLG